MPKKLSTLAYCLAFVALLVSACQPAPATLVPPMATLPPSATPDLPTPTPTLAPTTPPAATLIPPTPTDTPTIPPSPVTSQYFTWTERAKMPLPSRNGAAVTAGDKVYFMGGSGSLKMNYEYTPVSDTWIKRNDMLTDGWNMALCSTEGKIYAFGGDPFRVRSEVYDIQADSWEKLEFMPTPRQHVKCGAVGKMIYVLGGLEQGSVSASDSEGSWDGKALVSGKNERYDPATNTWQELAPMPIPMHSPNAYVAVTGKLIYVMGGMGDSDSIWTGLKTLEVYDTETDTWEIKADLPFPYFVGAAAVDEKLYALGQDESGRGMLAVYSAIEDTWTVLGDIPVARDQAGITAFDHSIFMIGGNDLNFKAYPNVYEIMLK